jgi:hypothetical protein
MRTAQDPFRFVVAFNVVRICREKAENLEQLAQALRKVSDGSIFYHTFQSPELHHPVPLANDFARWALAACNQSSLAERLSGIDVRGFLSLAELRNELVKIVSSQLEKSPEAAKQKAFEAFYFCESQETTIPTHSSAQNLAELAQGISGLSRQTFHYHMINSRLRLQLKTNDFSNWIKNGLHLREPAAELDQLDIYLNTIEDLRRETLEILRRWAEK